MRFNLLLLIYILMNTVKSYTTILLRLSQINMLEVAILLMISLIKYVFQKKTKDLNLSIFNIITGINESKILTKHVSRECKCKFDSKKCNSNQKRKNKNCWCKFKNPNIRCVFKKYYIGILLHVVIKLEYISQVSLTIQ